MIRKYIITIISAKVIRDVAIDPLVEPVPELNPVEPIKVNNEFILDLPFYISKPIIVINFEQIISYIIGKVKKSLSLIVYQ
jgi:hypothetical protein